MRAASAWVCAALLAGCAGGEVQKAGGAAGDAAARPLEDLNVVRAEIPPVLKAARQSPYAMPGDGGCEAIRTEVAALDAALGADLDQPATPGNPGLIERGTGAVGDVAGDALRNAAGSIIPFQSWIRRLSGAERYAREVGAAIAAGGVRRAFLKGLGQAGGCAPPAAPRR